MNKLPYKLAIFDCDGVLVDSEPLANQVFVQIVREYGFYINQSTYLKKFSGVTLPDRIHIISQELNWTPPADFLTEFNKRLIPLTERTLQPVAGIHELVESLSVPICVASNGTRDEVTLRLKLANLTPFFGNAIFSGMEVPKPKPAPDVYLAAAKAFDAPPHDCIVIEDSIPGVQAGVNAGMRVYGHAAFTPADKLLEAGAIPFANMFELRDMLALTYSQVEE